MKKEVCSYFVAYLNIAITVCTCMWNGTQCQTVVGKRYGGAVIDGTMIDGMGCGEYTPRGDRKCSHALTSCATVIHNMAHISAINEIGR